MNFKQFNELQGRILTATISTGLTLCTVALTVGIIVSVFKWLVL